MFCCWGGGGTRCLNEHLEKSCYVSIKIMKFSEMALSQYLQGSGLHFALSPLGRLQKTLHYPVLVLEDVGVWTNNTAALKSAI